MNVRDVSVVVPVRNGEHLIERCLRSILAAGPLEVIVVDGLSSDRTLEICAGLSVRVMSDGGAGLPAARQIGAEAARTDTVVLVDADVVVPGQGLERLLAEFERGGYTALQAGLHSVSGRGYWGRALAFHHRTGRSRHWFGLVATAFDRAALLRHGFDDRFSSGEDIDMRWRLRSAGCRIGVSREVVFEHRFDDDFVFAKGQWLADGAGLGRMVATRGRHALPLLALPFAAAGRGIALSMLRLQVQWVPYFLLYVAYNYIGIFGVLWRAAMGARPAGSPA